MRLRATSYGIMAIDQHDDIVAHSIAYVSSDEHPEAKVMAIRCRTCIDPTERDARWSICPQVIRRPDERIAVLMPEQQP
jgi:hypothetical protein